MLFELFPLFGHETIRGASKKSRRRANDAFRAKPQTEGFVKNGP